MARPVKITTPVPSLEEFAERLGLSKARRRSLGPIFIERRSDGRFAVRVSNTDRASAVLPTQRKAIERAREVSPNGTILVERVRQSSGGSRDKWRKA